MGHLRGDARRRDLSARIRCRPEVTTAAIPTNLEPAALQKAGDGWSSTRIAEWLLSEHGVRTTERTVRRLLEHTREERGTVAKAVVRDQLQKTLVNDIDRLEAIRADLEERALECLLPADGKQKVNPMAFTTYLKIRELEVKVLDRKLHYSGADEEADKEARFVIEVPGKASSAEEWEKTCKTPTG